jgi:hypothetical protein
VDAAVNARATTVVSVLRGSSTNDYDDEVDEPVPVHTGVPFSLIERTRRTYLPAEGANRVIRSYTGRTTHGTDIRKGDRIRDERTARIYVVTDLNDDPGSPVHRPDMVLELSRTS